MNSARARRRQQGSSLIEVLVAMLLIAIVLAGVLAALTASMRHRTGTTLRQGITAAANELGERIRANTGALGEDKGDRSNAYLAVLGTLPPSTPARSCDKVACTSDEFALWDTRQWWESLDARLPGAGLALLTTPAMPAPSNAVPSGFRTYQLEFYWKDPTSTEALAGCSAAAVNRISKLPDIGTNGVTCTVVTLRP